MSLFPLTLERALVRRRGKVLVGPVDLRFEGRKTTVLIGPNGSGKTSLLGAMHGTVRLSSGSVTWGCALEEARIAQTFVFQQPIVLRRSVRENILYPLKIRGIAKTEASKEAEIWAERMGLADMLERSALRLSGGERQKLALARALIVKPELVFLDEPCAALDGRATKLIEDVLAEAKAGGTSLILSTHDMGQARRLADDVIFLLHGTVHEHGPAETFFKDPKTPEASAFLRGDIVE